MAWQTGLAVTVFFRPPHLIPSREDDLKETTLGTLTVNLALAVAERRIRALRNVLQAVLS